MDSKNSSSSIPYFDAPSSAETSSSRVSIPTSSPNDFAAQIVRAMNESQFQKTTDLEKRIDDMENYLSLSKELINQTSKLIRLNRFFCIITPILEIALSVLCVYLIVGDSAPLHVLYIILGVFVGGSVLVDVMWLPTKVKNAEEQIQKNTTQIEALKKNIK